MGFIEELRMSIADSEEGQKDYIAEAIRNHGPNPNDWSDYFLGLVSVKAVYIGQERIKLQMLLGDSFTENEQDASFRTVAETYGYSAESVDNWPRETCIDVALQAKHYWEQQGVVFN